MGMDALDYKILSQLQLNSSMKSENLATLLNVTGRTIRRRLHAMKNRGDIKTIAVPNPVLLGFKGWSKIGLKAEPLTDDSIESKLLKHPNIYFVARTFGTFDFFIGAYFDSQEELAYFVNSELVMMPGIRNTETIPIIHPRKYYRFCWPAPLSKGSTKYQRQSELTKAYEIDEVDRKLFVLKEIDEYTIPSIPFLKAKLNISEGTIRKRIKNMIKNEVVKIEITPNPVILEYEVWSIIGIKVNLRSVHEVIDDIIQFPSVYLAATTLGRFNIILSARFHDTESFSQLINKDLPKIQGISSTESFILTKPLKYHNARWSYPPYKLYSAPMYLPQ